MTRRLAKMPEDLGSLTLSIERLTDGRRLIHLTRGDSTGYEVVVSEEFFLEMRKAFASDSTGVEVGPFTRDKFKVLVE
jgi:hypothetical protein